MLELLRLYKAGSVDLVTSEVTKGEIEAVPDRFRSRHETIYYLLKDIPVARAQWTDSGLTLMGVGGGPRQYPPNTPHNWRHPHQADAQHLGIRGQLNAGAR